MPSERIVLAGFSQGGALALNTALYHPKPLAGVLGLSTFLADGERLGSARARANAATPILMCHGLQDPVLPLTMGRAGFERLEQAGYPIHWREYSMAHEVCAEQMRDVRHWLIERLGQ